MPLPVTSLYAALAGLIGIVLWGLVGRARAAAKVSLGHGGDAALMEASRRHMNWVENVPFILLLFALIELNGGSRTWLHMMGSALVIARIVHPFGLSATRMNTWQRMVGAGMSFLVTIAATATVGWQAIQSYL